MTGQTEGQKKSNQIGYWEKAKICSLIVSTVVIPLAIGISGHWLSKSLKDKDIQVKYIELALNMLSQEPTEENNHIREWAIDVIDYYSKVPLSETLKDEFIKSKLRLRVSELEYDLFTRDLELQAIRARERLSTILKNHQNEKT